MKRTTRLVLASALGTVLSLATGHAAAQNTPTSPSGTGSTSSDAEVRRGVPGFDADVGTRDRGANSGMPGMDVDTRNTRTNPGDADTRRAGSGMRTERAARADRN